MKFSITTSTLILLFYSIALMGQEQMTSFFKFEPVSGYGRTIQHIDGVDYLLTRRDQGVVIDKLSAGKTVDRTVLDIRPNNPEEVKYDVLSDCVFDRYLVEVYETEVYVFDIVSGVFMHDIKLSKFNVSRVYNYQENEGILYLLVKTSEGRKFISYNYIDNTAKVLDFDGEQVLSMNRHYGYLFEKQASIISLIDFSTEDIINTIEGEEIDFVKEYENGFGPQILVKYIGNNKCSIINHENIVTNYSCNLPNLDTYDEVLILDNKLCLYNFDIEQGSNIEVYDLETCSFIISKKIGQQLYGEFYHHEYFGNDFLILDLGQSFEGQDGVKYFIQFSTKTVEFVFTSFQEIVKGNVVNDDDLLYMVGRDNQTVNGNYFSWKNLWIVNKNTLAEREEFFYHSVKSQDLVIGNRQSIDPLKIGHYTDLDSVFTYSFTEEPEEVDYVTAEKQHEFMFGVKNLKHYKVVDNNIFFYSNDSLYRTNNGATTAIASSQSGSDFVILDDEVVTVNKGSTSMTNEVRFDLSTDNYSSKELKFLGEGLSDYNITTDKYILGFGRIGDYYDIVNEKFDQVQLGIEEISNNGNTLLIRGEDYPIIGYYLQNLTAHELTYVVGIPDEAYPIFVDGNNGYYVVQNTELPYQVYHISDSGLKDLLYETSEEIDKKILHAVEIGASCLVLNVNGQAVCIGEADGDIQVFEIDYEEIEDVKLSNKMALLTTTFLTSNSKYLFDLKTEPSLLFGDVNQEATIKFVAIPYRILSIGQSNSEIYIYRINTPISSLYSIGNIELEQSNVQNNDLIFALSDSIFVFPLNNGFDGNELYSFNANKNETSIIFEWTGEKRIGVDPQNFTLTDGYLYFTANDDSGRRQWFRFKRNDLNVIDDQGGLQILPSLTDSHVTTTSNFKELRIFDQLGRILHVIYDYKAFQNIDVSQLPTGGYYLSGKASDSKITTGKFVKTGN